MPLWRKQVQHDTVNSANPKKNHKFLNFFSHFTAESATLTHIYIMREKMEEK